MECIIVRMINIRNKSPFHRESTTFLGLSLFSQVKIKNQHEFVHIRSKDIFGMRTKVKILGAGRYGISN